METKVGHKGGTQRWKQIGPLQNGVGNVLLRTQYELGLHSIGVLARDHPSLFPCHTSN